MLRELHISNLAVIADARIELEAGLNCFTGSTGAGKSLVIGAVQVLLGLKSPAEMLRPGAQEGRVSGIFDLNNPRTLAQIEKLTDVPVGADGGELLLTRRLYASGRSTISLNGSPITLGMLKNLSETLVDVHGQHDHQYLLRPSNQLDVLDRFGDLGPLRQTYEEVYQRLQAGEIDAADLHAAEYAELEGRALVLRNLEKLKKEAGAVHDALYETEGSALERLKMMTGVLAELCGLDTNLKDVATTVRDATIALEEAAFDLSRYLDKLDVDPAEIAEVDQRLNTINRILSKYGRTVQEVLDQRHELAGKIAGLEKATDDLSSLRSQVEPLDKQVRSLAAQLSDKRKTAAKRLAGKVEKQLAELGMEKAVFRIDFAAAPAEGGVLGASGIDSIEFIVQTNPGQSAHPLRKIASGGELSRIMLGLKGILADSDRISVLVFDEIDANVGGRLGSVIGRKLRGLAAHHQVLCITHLPQIASYADRHLTVRKVMARNDTQTSVRMVLGEERIGELAEMIGGPRVTDTTRAQARELLEEAQAEAAAEKPKRERVKL